MTVKDIINKYKIANGSDFRPLSFEGFAEALTNAGCSISASTVYRWAVGTLPINPEKLEPLKNSDTWVRDFAVEVLALVSKAEAAEVGEGSSE